MTRPLFRAQGFLGLMALLLIWELVARLFFPALATFPPPSRVISALIRIFQEPSFYGEFIYTMVAAVLGWSLAVPAGIAVGVFLGLSPAALNYSLASVEFLRPLPGIAFVPLALLLFGFSLRAELLVIVIPTFWPVLVNTLSGIKATPARLKDVCSSMRVSLLRSIFSVYLPQAASSILVGCRLSLSLSLVMAIAVEIIGIPSGLGYALMREQQALNPDAMFAYIIVIGCLGIFLNWVLNAFAHTVFAPLFAREKAV
jgi:sulfonate transport system permease protein